MNAVTKLANRKRPQLDPGTLRQRRVGCLSYPLILARAGDRGPVDKPTADGKTIRIAPGIDAGAYRAAKRGREYAQAHGLTTNGNRTDGKLPPSVARKLARAAAKV